MSAMNAEPTLKLGALCWNQYSDWPSLLRAGQRAEQLGFDTLWTWDHLYPIVGSPEGPFFEGYMMLAAWAQATQRIRLGLMVGANPFRNPALVAKMVTTLDHISNGRAILGIGSAWNETEARAFGIDFGESPAERLRWLREALPVMRGMLHGEQPTASGPRYAMQEVRNDPPPISRPLPILIGGGGEKVTLRLVARYADMNNVGGGFDNVARKEQILRGHCAEVGRDEAEIERTANLGPIVIRDTYDEALRALHEIYAHNGGARTWSGRRPEDQPIGPPERLAEEMARYISIGYRHLVIGFAAPYDEETMARLANEVRPMLSAATTLATA
jgi:alkanesulfonate monooxygenase SsuD/methylene tetrahydromethanopterin reductase-like flavin-dependent oxidoreductase (luciferase family)